MRVKAGLFASNSNGLPTYNANNQLTGFTPPTINTAWVNLGTDDGIPTAVALDVTSEQIKIGSWVAMPVPHCQTLARPLTQQLTTKSQRPLLSPWQLDLALQASPLSSP